MDMETMIGAIEQRKRIAERNNQAFVDLPYEIVGDALAMLKEQQQQIWEFQDQVEYLTDKQKEQKFLVDSDGKITPLPVVVRCKDCKHRGDRHKCIVAFVAEKQEMPYFFYDNRGEWFCADGKRKEGR